MKTALEATKTSLEIKCIIKKLKNGELEVRSVPEEFALDIDVVKTERELGIRKSGHRGFDVITQKFFVEEEWFHKNILSHIVSCPHKITFDSFVEYYNFLDGDIYEDACYYQYVFDDEFSKSLNLDMNRLRKIKSFVTETIDDYSYELSENEIAEYKHYEKSNKKFVKQWIAKFNACDTYKQFRKVCNNYEKSSVSQYKRIEFFFFQYAFDAQCNKKHLDVIMEYLSKDYYWGGNAVLGLCLIHTPELILNKYDFSQASVSTNRKRKKELKDFAERLKNQDVKIEVKGYFDKITHFYCEEMKVYCYENRQGRKLLNKWCSADVCQAFETFDEFIKYRNGDLTNCDLSEAIDLNIDFSKYTTDDTTKLPINKNTNLNYKVRKLYTKGGFGVGQFWYDEFDKCVKKQAHTFLYFFDFVAFLKGDLSGADLLFCTGMKNLSDINGINLSNARMTSELCEKFHIQYNSYDYDEKLINEFPAVEKNEEETALVLQSSREVVLSDSDMFLGNDNRISYISDLHLMHRIKNAGCKSKEDVIYTIQKIVDRILSESTCLTLIGGDVSSEFVVFELFVKMLRKYADRLHGRYDLPFEKRNFVFVLGNHELWNFPELSVKQIVNKYRTVLKENGMYLLHNDLFYKNEFDDMGIVPYEELVQLDNSVISEKLRYTRLVILGSLGFSGYNEEFNAKDGVYRTTLDRNTEIQASRTFEQLYNKLIDILAKKNTIIFTHTPMKDWSADVVYHDNFVYVSGHNHKNTFFDDGVERIYADNQIGYRNETPHLKSFLMAGEYDYFESYEDGIYEITSQEYQNFYRGKNIQMTFNRQVHILYMLKKNSYYCFIHKTKTGSLSLLNGGALKRLEVTDVQYYYDNMDKVIASIEEPLKKYTTYQESIANEIRRINGSGRIHGCIIDIDFNNHIYVNPVDMTVTSYWASDIINKLVYPSIPALLKAECPELYANYLKLIENKEAAPLMTKQTENKIALLPQEYLETDIYKASREIKKMQKLSSNILTIWCDYALDKELKLENSYKFLTR
ncbi:MAG: metallophosphoesterase [Blautia producta]